MIKFLAVILLIVAVSCTYTEKIKDGQTAYDRKQFSVAIPMLSNEYKKAKTPQEKGKKAYQIAESYRRTNQYEEAAKWFEKATAERFSADSPLKQAQMLQQAEKYDEAITAYRTAGRDAGNADKFLEQIAACRTAKQWAIESKDNEYSLETLPINNNATDFSPIVMSKDQVIFSSDRAESEGKNKYRWTGQKFFDLYSWDRTTDSIKRFIAPQINPKFHQGNLVYSKDGNKLFYTQCGSEDQKEIEFCKIMFSEKKGDIWTEPKALNLGPNNFNYMHPCIDAEGKWLIFATNDKQGFGGYDLYISLWVPTEKRWSEARNLGAAINTKGNEVFPFLDLDTLYYSSDGLPGMGGLDIFKAPKVYERWKDPVNLKAPLNSGGDDFGLVTDPFANLKDSIQQIGFICSNRKGSKGSDDIYRYSKKIPKKIEIPVVVDTPKIVYRLDFEGIAKEKILAQPGNPNSEVTGFKNLMGVTIRFNSSDTAWAVGSESDGSFTAVLKPGKMYYLQNTKDGYMSSFDTISTLDIVLTDSNPIQVIKKEVFLTPIYRGKEIVLKDVKFDFNKWDIRPDAAAELDRLVILLKQNPELNILMTSHTDCRGTDRDNMLLSQRRAESTMRYLITKGIPEGRLQARGFGETTPAAQCACTTCTEDQHQENRRTSFVILE
jgi:outer membrane protein OmpA-like peptidoglycan-associated protein/tetratricopeptide (TPR) repeat protein